ncbi:hypothetical protein [Blastochloris sulfoviridis]|uniref:Uncharacterized protein n=1 Tax=Blastochloris sulfoviridis TaxID=50712 RepID=A0A5M6HUL8_9HYPH|nr:hypothetical protein [Blastochloris sulfoviridis]KAA5599475.1 hypothetical protein F1193_12085 [Blastochloris sulfoviridis]
MARVEPTSPVSVLTLRETYGPARGFAGGIANLVVDGADAQAATAPGRVLVVASKPFTLAYDCVLPDYADAVSLLRGFRRGDALFVPGMALFHRLHGEADCEVRLDIPDALTIGLDPSRGHHDGAALERCHFVIGDVMMRTCGRTLFVHERGFPFALDELSGVWPRLMAEAGRLFGETAPADWTACLFASSEHPPGRPGAGFALPDGALVSVSADDDRLATPHTLWLLLHERLHHWLGCAIGRAGPADDWFFEGFTNFLTCEALQRTGRLSRPELARLVRLSRRAVREASGSIEPPLAHRGFLAARRWHAALVRQGAALPGILTRLVAARRGAALGGAELLAALAQASPDGRVPEALRRLAEE